MLRSVAVDEILGRAAKDNLAGDADGRIFFESDGRVFLSLLSKTIVTLAFVTPA